MIKYLLGRASTGKFRFAVVECDEKWDDDAQGYIIQRSYGQVRGKTTLSPQIIVDRTKQKRTWKEQYTLQFNSEVKKYLDKGYKEVEKHPNEYTDDELLTIFGKVKTNQYGVIKPQLAKQADKVTNKKIFDKEWLISRKLDGVKALFYLGEDGEVHTASRGGEHYDYSTTHLRNNPSLVAFFKENPSIILDGELFVRGKSLQTLSGAARMEKNAYDCDWLQYWVYDCYNSADVDMIASDRYKFLEESFVKTYNFPIYKSSEDESDTPIRLLVHEYVSGWGNMKKLHDDWVSAGFEGAVITDPTKPYKVGSRCNNLIKIKQYKSEDFTVIGYKLGLRGSEDMTFTCQLEDGRTFEAMPCGDRDTKAEYVENFEEKYKGHKAECTFFNYSDDGLPTQPKMRVFRFDLE